ncbi:hypothetical protein RQP46_008306 [Phenoliferia psychrophenolica]
MSAAEFDPARWLDLLPAPSTRVFEGALSSHSAPLQPSFLRHSPNVPLLPLPYPPPPSFLHQYQAQHPQPRFTDRDGGAPSIAFPSPPLQPRPTLDSHEPSGNAIRRYSFEMQSIRGGANPGPLPGAGGPHHSGAPGHEQWQGQGGHNGYDFALASPNLQSIPTVTTPRAPMLVLVPDGGPEKGDAPRAAGGMGDEDRAAVKGLLGLGGSTPVGGVGPQEASVMGLAAPFVDEPIDDLDLDHDSSASSSGSDDAEGDDDDDDGDEEYQDSGLANGDEDYTDKPDRRGAVTRFAPRDLRRARTTSTTLSVSHTSSLTTPPTRSPSPTFPAARNNAEEDASGSDDGEGSDDSTQSPPAPAAAAKSHPLKRSISLSGSTSTRTTALPNKRRYRTSTTSGSGAFRCLHPNPEGGDPCPVSFRRSYDLARHRDSKHADGAKASTGWRCRTCGGEFARKDSLQRHAANKSHQGLDPES